MESFFHFRNNSCIWVDIRTSSVFDPGALPDAAVDGRCRKIVLVLSHRRRSVADPEDCPVYWINDSKLGVLDVVLGLDLDLWPCLSSFSSPF